MACNSKPTSYINELKTLLVESFQFLDPGPIVYRILHNTLFPEHRIAVKDDRNETDDTRLRDLRLQTLISNCIAAGDRGLVSSIIYTHIFPPLDLSSDDISNFVSQLLFDTNHPAIHPAPDFDVYNTDLQDTPIPIKQPSTKIVPKTDTDPSAKKRKRVSAAVAPANKKHKSQGAPHPVLDTEQSDIPIINPPNRPTSAAIPLKPPDPSIPPQTHSQTERKQTPSRTSSKTLLVPEAAYLKSNVQQTPTQHKSKDRNILPAENGILAKARTSDNMVIKKEKIYNHRSKNLNTRTQLEDATPKLPQSHKALSNHHSESTIKSVSSVGTEKAAKTTASALHLHSDSNSLNAIPAAKPQSKPKLKLKPEASAGCAVPMQCSSSQAPRNPKHVQLHADGPSTGPEVQKDKPPNRKVPTMTTPPRQHVEESCVLRPTSTTTTNNHSAADSHNRGEKPQSIDQTHRAHSPNQPLGTRKSKRLGAETDVLAQDQAQIDPGQPIYEEQNCEESEVEFEDRLSNTLDDIQMRVAKKDNYHRTIVMFGKVLKARPPKR